MNAIRSEYAAHDALLDSVGLSSAMGRRFAAIKPAPSRKPAARQPGVCTYCATVAAALLACLVLVLAGCGGGDYCDDPAPGTAAECGGVACTICRGYVDQTHMSIPSRPASAAGI